LTNYILNYNLSSIWFSPTRFNYL